MMDVHHFWHQALPDLYRAELECLHNHLSFFEFLQEIPHENNRGIIVVSGILSFDSGLRKQRVEIHFPHGYPHSAPQVFPLDPNHAIVSHYRRGNQYANGRICLFDEDKDWRAYINSVSDALRQAAIWLETANSPEGFKKEQIVAEGEQALQHEGQIIFYGEKDFPEAANGVMHLKTFDKDKYSLLQIHFDTSSGVEIISTFPDNTPLAQSGNEIILGRWFRVPNMGFKEVIGNFLTNDITGGQTRTVIDFARFLQFLITSLNADINDIFCSNENVIRNTVIGLICGLEKEIQFFRISSFRSGVQVYPKVTYLFPNNLSNDLFKRADSLLNINALQSKRVLVIGLGAIGSEVAKEIATSGISNLL